MTRKLPGTVAWIAIMLAAPGCYHHHLTTYGPVNLLPQKSKTVNAGWTGAILPSDQTPAEDACRGATFSNGMHVVGLDSNLGFAAISVVTLGFASPVRVGWVCTSPVPVTGPTPSRARSGSTAPPTASGTTPAGNPQPEAPYTSRTVTSIAWGALQVDAKAPENQRVQRPGGLRPPDPAGPITPANCHDYGMRKVRIRGFPLNFLDSLATVATLGFVSPLRVGWQCAQPPDNSPTGSAPAQEESHGAQ